MTSVNTIVVPLPAQDDTVLVMRAPGKGKGGGITVTEAYVVNHAATAATIGFAVALRKLSNAGTPAVNGTVAPAVGGTNDHFADSVPKPMAVASGSPGFLAAGEWLGLEFTGTNGGTPTRGYLVVNYAEGRAG